MGGAVNERYGITVAFETACAVMLSAVLFTLLAMPSVSKEQASADEEKTSALSKVIKPFKTLLPIRISRTGASGTRLSYQRSLLALGVLFGVVRQIFLRSKEVW